MSVYCTHFYSHFQLTAYLFFKRPFCRFAQPSGNPSTQTSVQPSLPSASTVSPFKYRITRHPFPGPGLAVRILGDITPDKVRILQDADDIYIRGLRNYKVKLSGEEARLVLAAGVPANMQNGEIEVSLYDQIWQAGTVLLSTVRSVGVMGDERTYEHPVALRAVTSTDAMTADWAHLPYDFMAKVSNEIINKVRGVNRVCYDIS